MESCSMSANMLRPDELPDLRIDRLGECTIPSPLKGRKVFTGDDERIAIYVDTRTLSSLAGGHEEIPSFEAAGPRKKIYFDPAKLKCGIVTCGGLCPGLNDVIRAITLHLSWMYGIEKVYGFRYGYAGLTRNAPKPPIELTPDAVEDIHQMPGGDILGSSRGPQDMTEIADTLERMGVGLLFVIGGDGTMRGAWELVNIIERRRKKIAIIAVPKTIDNDICGIYHSFGFSTAIEATRAPILTAHAEAKGAWNGVGLVKVMGRDAGFIAANAALASSDVNFCFIPESPVKMNGEGGFLPALERRLDKKHHAVVLVAEGVGEVVDERDQSGNVRRQDIGPVMKKRILDYFAERGKPVAVKYIDPSYMVRSLQTDTNDATFCLMLGQNAVHAGMCGRTNMVIGNWNQHFVHIPIDLVTMRRKRVDPNGDLWQTVLDTTGQVKW